MSIRVPLLREGNTVHVRHHYEPALGGISTWRRGNAYNYGVGPAHYPVPAIWYEHKISPDPFMVNGAFMVELRDSLGWADYICFGDGVDDHTSWSKDQCRNCGNLGHHTEECFLF